MKIILVPSFLDPIRADRFLQRNIEHASRAEISRWFREKQVRCNGKKIKKGDFLVDGDQIELRAPLNWLCPAKNPAITTLSISAQNSLLEILAFNKPAGVPTLPKERNEGKTLADHIAFLHPECQFAAPHTPWECGIGHRLDTYTSGVVLAARTPMAYQQLRTAFESELVDKSYLALIEGICTKTFQEERPIAHHPSERQKMVVLTSNEVKKRGAPQPATTTFTPLWTNTKRTLVHVKAMGGRRHQVRVHAAINGHPLAGDALYKGTPCSPLIQHALHAWQISALGFSAIAPVPTDFLRACSPQKEAQNELLRLLAAFSPAEPTKQPPR